MRLAKFACPALAMLVLVAGWVQGASFDKPEPPEPLELELDLRSAWDQATIVLEKMGYAVESQDRAEGRILTRVDDSISGAYTMSELKKIVVLATDYTTSYSRGKYNLELSIQFLAPKKTSVGVTAHVQGLKRDLEGHEEWVGLKTNGVLEMRYLNELSYLVTGKRIYDKKLPYWRKSSQEITIKE